MADYTRRLDGRRYTRNAAKHRLITCAVAHAKGENFPADMAPEMVERSARLPAGMKPSMLLDLEQGNRLELEWLTGAVVRIGVENAVPVPESQKVYENLKPFAEGSA